jgi:hypothetical protein
VLQSYDGPSIAIALEIVTGLALSIGSRLVLASAFGGLARAVQVVRYSTRGKASDQPKPAKILLPLMLAKH